VTDSPRPIHAPSELPRSGMLTVAFAGFATFIDLYATQPLLPRFVETFHASKAEVGLTVSAPTVAVALIAPVLGIFGDKLSRTRTIVLSILALAIFTFLAATASGLPSLVFWRFLQGAATPGVYVMVLAYVSEEAGPTTVGRAMAAFVTGNVVGGYAGRAITGYLADSCGWQVAFCILGALNLLGAFVTWRWLPPSRNFDHRARRTDESARLGQRLRRLGTPRLIATFAIGFNVLFAIVGTFSYVVFYLTAAPFSLTTGNLGAVFAVYLVGAVVTPLAGRLIDRAGACAVLVSALVVGAAGISLTLIPSLAAVVARLACVCSSAFVCQSASTSQLRVGAPPGLRSLASGVYVMVYYIGGSAGGVVPGLLWSRFHWGGCVALVGVQLLTAALAMRFWRAPPARSETA
jgi:YNFM family putative membrane transporter